MAVAEVRILRQLREENAKLKRLEADLSLDKSMLTEILRKQPEAGTVTRVRDLGAEHLPSRDSAGVPAVIELEGAVVLPQPPACADGAGDAHPGVGPCPLFAIETCARCQGRLRVIASIEKPEVFERILAHR
jgi:hypothetical protein